MDSRFVLVMAVLCAALVPVAGADDAPRVPGPAPEVQQPVVRFEAYAYDLTPELLARVPLPGRERLRKEGILRGEEALKLLQAMRGPRARDSIAPRITMPPGAAGRMLVSREQGTPYDIRVVTAIRANRVDLDLVVFDEIPGRAPGQTPGAFETRTGRMLSTWLSLADGECAALWVSATRDAPNPAVIIVAAHVLRERNEPEAAPPPAPVIPHPPEAPK